LLELVTEHDADVRSVKGLGPLDPGPPRESCVNTEPVNSWSLDTEKDRDYVIDLFGRQGLSRAV